MKRIRLHCFPHAGAGASAYVRWSARLPASIEIDRPQLPGRESRYGEPMPASLLALAESVASGLGRGGVPFALFGHSFGGMLAFEVARTLRRQGRDMPSVLVVSASAPPHLPDRRPGLHRFSGEAFQQELRRLGATEDLLASQELMEIMTPIIQGDSRLAAEYRYVEEPPLPCAIAAYGGDADPSVYPEDMEAWRIHTSGPFQARVFRGGHMYVQPGSEELFDRLAEDLLSLAAQVDG